uniref:Uncharacterized protein n=1 Tax=Brassica oleracea TaxID=3712 RepID=A0A3P6BSX2_BRAOL|nr:unnamed protein product [Brassica oleracea]
MTTHFSTLLTKTEHQTFKPFKNTNLTIQPKKRRRRKCLCFFFFFYYSHSSLYLHNPQSETFSKLVVYQVGCFQTTWRVTV